ncbi:MAG: hypothetical protein NC299_12310 [Lachnospiraceae bacterium]|nr:hypothetical protein [Ruminococcus sp.]MCM1276124.1 hypothetical protein [Lachnospiraceae bacterium]
MKLSKQERIGALIIVVILILALGGFLLVKPKIETIGTTRASLASKQQEYDADVEKQNRKAPLREQIEKAYEDGEHMADMFFSELSAYEADMAFRAFLEQCGANVVIEELTVSEPTTATLGTNFYTRPDVQYDLKTYATQGADIDEDYAAILQRQANLAAALGDAQTIGASTVSFTVKAVDQDELIKFADAVNSYKLEENGALVRKAVGINGLAFTYPDVISKYEKLVEEINEEAEEAGKAALERETGLPTEIERDNGTAANPADPTNPAGAEEEQEIAEITDYLYSYSDTFTFYCIERMQDPKSQLDAQDGISA